LPRQKKTKQQNLKFFLFLALFFLKVSVLLSQECNCHSVVSHTIKVIEEDYPGYKLKTDVKRTGYLNLRQKVLRKSGTLKILECYELLKSYLAFFRDPHLNINFISNKENEGKLRDVFSKYGKIPDWKKIINTRFADTEVDSVRGIWANEDSSYTVVIEKVADKTYSGVIKKADSIFWFPGQVKFKFNLKKGNSKLIYFRRYHEPEEANFFLTKKFLYITRYGYWKKVSPFVKEGQRMNIDSFFKFYLKKTGDSTFLMRLPNFTLGSKRVIDSLVFLYSKVIKNTPNLIIDIRDNPGGFSSSFGSLLQYVYSGRFPHPSFSILASEGNIKLYKKFAEDNKFKENDEIFQLIANLEANKGKFYKVLDTGSTNVDTVYLYPKKVVFLINKGTVSAAEDLLLKVRYSTKVTLIGENTRGALDFQNIIQARKIPECQYISLSCPTGASLDGPKIDNIGVSPDIRIYTKTDWLSFAVKYLENVKILDR
jgi:hypothetical protein